MSILTALVHYIVPRSSNDHRAKLLHFSTLVLITIAYSLFQFFLYKTAPRTNIVLGYASQISINDLVYYTNQKREQNGASTVALNTQLSEAAKKKGEHMLSQDYWAHIAPDGTEPWYFFGQVGYKYRYAGENLARDFTNASAAVDAWMASPAHRDNMLSTKYQEMGLAVVEGDLNGKDTTIIVQLFGTKLDGSSSVPVASANTANINKPTTVPTQVPISTPTSTPAVSPSTTPEPTIVPQILQNTPPTETNNALQSQIYPFELNRMISFALVGLLLLVTIVDGLIVFHKKIPRIGGRAFAHFSFFCMILAIIMIAKAGRIL